MCRDLFRTLLLPWNKCSCARVECGTRSTRTRVLFFIFPSFIYSHTHSVFHFSFFIFPSIYLQHTHGILLLPIRAFWSSSGTLKVRPGGTLDQQVSSYTWTSSLPCDPLSCMGRPAPRFARTRDLFGTLLLSWNKCTRSRVERGTRSKRAHVSFFIFPSIYSHTQHTHSCFILHTIYLQRAHGTLLLPIRLLVCTKMKRKNNIYYKIEKAKVVCMKGWKQDP
jgi:hypothetical protein